MDGGQIRTDKEWHLSSIHDSHFADGSRLARVTLDDVLMSFARDESTFYLILESWETDIVIFKGGDFWAFACSTGICFCFFDFLSFFFIIFFSREGDWFIFAFLCYFFSWWIRRFLYLFPWFLKNWYRGIWNLSISFFTWNVVWIFHLAEFPTELKLMLLCSVIKNSF